jgi:predicted metal-dependent hydrolase
VPTVSIGTREIPYTVVRGAGRRYTYLRFRPDMTLEVVVPSGRAVDVKSILREREEWIMRRMDRLSLVSCVIDRDSVLFSGERLKILFVPNDDFVLLPELSRGRVVVRVKEKSVAIELIRRWFLKESSAYVVARVPELAAELGARYNRVDVREMKPWGYCTRRGRLSFSWQLIALPERLREYVVLHELTHLGEFSHSQEFKRKLALVCPDFKDREEELNRIMPYDLGRSPNSPFD